jgi:predicted nucleotidyltransferase
MTEKDYEIAKELKERLSRIVHLVDFRIFGSRARDKAEKYSDMDVFIEVEHINKELEDEIYHITWEVGLKHSIFISPLVFSRYEIEDSPLRASPIVKNIEEDGVRV